MISAILVIFSIIVFLRISKFYQVVLISLSALLPFTFGNFRSIEELMFIEWITPVALLALIYELAPPLAVKKLNIINFEGIGTFIFAIAILFTWTLISILSNELFPDPVIFSESIRSDYLNTGTKRLYFNIFNNIILFFITIIYFVVYFDEIDFPKYFEIILYVALIVGIIRIVSYFMGLNVPMLGGTFDYGGQYGKYSSIKYGGTAYRLGGLAEVAVIGIPSLFALSIIKSKLNLFALVTLLFFLFLSGGRTMMIGSIFAIIIYSILFYPKNFGYFFTAGILIIAVVVLLLPDKVVKGQIGRLTSFSESNDLLQDDGRSLVWNLYMKNFRNSPVFGKGIAPHRDYLFTGDIQSNSFVKSQVFSGGHGSYISLLSTFGIGGLLYFIILVFGGIYYSYNNIVKYSKNNITMTAISVFVFMLLIIKSVDFITGGNGLTIPLLFFAVGVIASLTIHANLDDI